MLDSAGMLAENLCPDAADLSVLPETNIKVDIHLKVKES